MTEIWKPLSCCSDRLPRGFVARQATTLINSAAAKGLLLDRTFHSVKKALFYKEGTVILKSETVIGYAEFYEVKDEPCFVIRSVVVEPESQGQGYSKQLLRNRIARCKQLNPLLPIILACDREIIDVYAKNGFVLQPKQKAPICVRGGRSETDWIKCNREWMNIPS